MKKTHAVWTIGGLVGIIILLFLSQWIKFNLNFWGAMILIVLTYILTRVYDYATRPYTAKRVIDKINDRWGGKFDTTQAQITRYTKKHWLVGFPEPVCFIVDPTLKGEDIVEAKENMTYENFKEYIEKSPPPFFDELKKDEEEEKQKEEKAQEEI